MTLDEIKYLDAKMAFYDGMPIMSNEEFDALEQKLNIEGSKITNQIGSKKSDFDYPHPNRMGSLDKIQTTVDDIKYDEFLKWLNSIPNFTEKLAKSKLIATPKYDGNSINLVYNNGKLVKAITRGDGTYGKDVTDKIIVPSFDFEINEEGIVEVRCEGIMLDSVFNEKYSNYANSRNLVAGLLGRDNLEVCDAQNINLVPLVVLQNGEHHPINLNTFSYEFGYDEDSYREMYNFFVEYRKRCEYQLDGIVISFSHEYRDEIGEGDKCPKWSKAIKFVCDNKDSIIDNIEYQIGKSREIIPVSVIKPIELAGTVVTRVTCFNAGFIVANNITVGTRVSVCKRGDIIPHIEEVFKTENEVYKLPDVCPYCNANTHLDGIHLYCTNVDCCGAKLFKLVDTMKILNIKGVGTSALEYFSHIDEIKNGLDFLRYVKENIDEMSKLGFKGTHIKRYNSFKESINNIRDIDVTQLIQMYNIDGVGIRTATELGREFSLLSANYSGMDSTFTNEKFKKRLFDKMQEDICELSEKYNIFIKHIKDNDNNEGIIYVELTGSPKEYGFDTKKAWLSQFNGRVEVCKLSDKRCNFLVTDDLTSASSKMKTAKSKNISIITYGDTI